MTIRIWFEDNDYHETNKGSWRLAYAAGFLAWVLSGTNELYLFRLVSSVLTTLRAPQSEEIQLMAISTTMLAVTTKTGNCHVWKLSGAELEEIATTVPVTFKLRSSEVWRLVVSASTVAVVYDKATEKRADITICDVETLETDHRLLPSQTELSRIRDRCIVATRQGKYIIHAEVVHGAARTIHFAKLKASGEMESDWSIELNDVGGFTKLPQYAAPSNKTGCETLYSYIQCTPATLPDSKSRYKWKITRVCYFFDDDRIEVKRQTAHGMDPQASKPGNFFWRNNIAYFRDKSGKAGELAVMDLNGGSCRKAEMSAPELIPEWARDVMETERSGNKTDVRSIILGDETFLFSVWRGYFVIWCFDKNIRLPLDYMSYQENMREGREQRRRDRENHRRLFAG